MDNYRTLLRGAICILFVFCLILAGCGDDGQKKDGKTKTVGKVGKKIGKTDKKIDAPKGADAGSQRVKKKIFGKKTGSESAGKSGESLEDTQKTSPADLKVAGASGPEPSKKVKGVPDKSVKKSPKPAEVKSGKKTTEAPEPAKSDEKTKTEVAGDSSVSPKDPDPGVGKGGVDDLIVSKDTDLGKDVTASPKDSGAGKGAVDDLIVPPKETEAGTEDLIVSVKDAPEKEAERYNPRGRIDPFAPLIREEEAVERPEKRKKERLKRPKTPLEKVDISQLKLVGVIRAGTGNRALVEQADGKGFIIKKGMFIGINSGIIVEIMRDRVIVEEEQEDWKGTVSKRKRELKLQKPPGEDSYEM